MNLKVNNPEQPDTDTLLLYVVGDCFKIQQI